MDAIRMSQKILLFITILLLPITFMPERYIIFHLGRLASIYPMILLEMVTLFEIVKYRNVTKNEKKIITYIVIYAIFQIISSICGAYNYEYMGLLNANQKVFLFDAIPADVTFLLVKSLKPIISGTIVPFTFCFCIIHIFSRNWNRWFVFVTRTVEILFCIMATYSLIEIGFLAGNKQAFEILSVINPFLYDVAIKQGWWPPLVWVNGVRSICPEASFLGIVGTFIGPFLIAQLYNRTSFKNMSLVFFFIFMMFMSRSRSAIVSIEAMVVTIFTFLYKCTPKAVFAKCFAIVAMSTVISFLAAATFFYDNSSITVKRKEAETKKISAAITKYSDDNIKSVVGNKRSNVSRYINAEALIKVGIKHPILGVGSGLVDAYLADEVSESQLNNYEVREWIRNFCILGISDGDIPILSQYTRAIASNGFVGLLLYLTPVFLTLRQVFFLRKKLLGEYKFLIILSGLLINLILMCSNTVFISFYIVLGMTIAKLSECDAKADNGLESF